MKNHSDICVLVDRMMANLGYALLREAIRDNKSVEKNGSELRRN